VGTEGYLSKDCLLSDFGSEFNNKMNSISVGNGVAKSFKGLGLRGGVLVSLFSCFTFFSSFLRHSLVV
jgi:hypothetical protein